MSRPAGPLRLPGRRPGGPGVTVWVEGTTSNGMTGLAIDQHGNVCSRSCQVCEHRLDDVDGLGTHPLCDPDGRIAAWLAQHDAVEDGDGDGAW